MRFATLEWKNGLPFAADFGDIYFSNENGKQETEHVFVQGNQLETRFPNARAGFTVIETGFGTGLNFFVVAAKWLQLAPANSQLTFISTEKYPISHTDILLACQHWPEFAELQQFFLPYYSQLKAGHNIWRITPQLTLQLWIADVMDALPAITATADAWLLDGFAPARNPAMWSEHLFKQMAHLSKPGISTFSTFTSAGHVRRGLQAAGFEVHKRPGFGKKREMICGSFKGQVT